MYAIESPKLAQYEPDGVVAALKDFIQQKKPTLVLFPHTYQVRDFAPRLASALERTLISDAIGFHKREDKLLFTRQMFQGKFVADVSFTGPAPWLVTFQSGRTVGTRLKLASSAPVETVERRKPRRALSATAARRPLRKPSRPSICPRPRSS